MARKELAGLAALGALAMMANRSKKTEVEEPGEINERMDRANAISRGKTNLVDTGMSTPEPDENYAGLRTSSVGADTASPRMKTPAVRKSPRIGGYTSDSEQIARSRPTNPIDELNRATGAKPMDPNSDRGPNAVTGTELDRNVDNAMNAVGGSGLKVVRNLAKGLANRTGKIPEYIQKEIGMSRPMLPKPGQTYGEGFVMNRKNGGVTKMAKGGMARSSASSRGDGIASKGKTRGRMR
jgi:hypothetical protein